MRLLPDASTRPCGVAAAIGKSVDDASFTGLFDAIASVIAQQFVLTPYYFSVFHQNRERRLLREITGIFLREYPKTLINLRNAVATRNYALAREAEHTLKGEASCLAAEATLAEVERLRQDLKAEDAAAADNALKRLEVELARLEPELKQLLEVPV